MIIISSQENIIRKKLINKFTNYINNNYNIKHKINLIIKDYPCVFTYKKEPCFGIFYIEQNNKIYIELANNLEWYYYITKIPIKYKAYYNDWFLLNFAHEITHYFQYLNTGKTHERYVDNHALKLIKNFYTLKKRKKILIDNMSYDKNTHDLFPAIDPSK